MQALISFPTVAAAALTMLSATHARAELSAEELAKLAQNPVGNLISVPFQNDTNLNFGPERKTQFRRSGCGASRYLTIHRQYSNSPSSGSALWAQPDLRGER